MHSVHIDLPIFIGPNVAFGYFACDIEVDRMPASGTPFPWPQAWLATHEALLVGQANQVWGQAPWKGPASGTHFTLFGIVCADRKTADALVHRIEEVEGCMFTEHVEPSSPPS